MRILVTGAAGFVGSHVAERLLDEGHAVRALVRPANVPRWLAARGAELVLGDLTDERSLEAACRGRDVVVHAAALVTEVAVSQEAYLRINAAASATLARAAAAAGARRFVFVGSTSVHEPNTGRAIDVRTPLAPVEIYGVSKAAAERGLEAVAAETGLELAIVRPSRVYGPRDRSLLRVFRAIDRRRFAVVGSGRAEVDFVFATDVAAALAAACRHGSGVYLVGGPERVTLERFFREIAAALGRRLPRVRVPLLPAVLIAWLVARAYLAAGREPPIAPKRFAFFRNSRVVDSSRAAAELGYAPQVDVREGVARTVSWYREAGWL